MTHVFRADNTNVGDWFCPPFRYFPFRPAQAMDILAPAIDLAGAKVVIVGGGGLGTEFFAPYLRKLENPNRDYALVAWGVGIDQVSDRNAVLDPDGTYDLYGNWFESFDDVGIRVHSDQQKFRAVSCASCMHPEFFRFRERKPTGLIGIYNHKRVPLMQPGNQSGFAVCDNDGDDLIAKLEFLSSHEYIVTNTYHGVFWATLLNRKVICIPFKSGCFSFEHRPTYSQGEVTEDLLHSAVSYPDSLELARRENLDYYAYLLDRYGDI